MKINFSVFIFAIQTTDKYHPLMPKRVVLSTEALNQYGTWLPASGARLKRFMSNPVMFYDHQTYKMPIGHWENIRIENNRIIADPVFDEGDPVAKDVKRKWENGDIKGASMGVDIITLSDSPEWIKPGQKRPTVIEYDPYEASMTPLPNNEECLTLRREGIMLSNGISDEIVGKILPELKPINKMKKIALKLGLAEEATEDQIIVKIDGMLANEKNNLVLKKFIDDQATGLDAEAKEAYDSLKDKDPENALRVLKLSRKAEKTAEDSPGADAGGKPAEEKPMKVSDIINQAMDLARGKKKDDEPDKESFDYLQKNDPGKLVNLRRTDPAKFQKLVDEYTASKKAHKQ